MYTEAQQLLSSDREEDRCAAIEIVVAAGQNSGIELLAMQLEREQSTFVRRRLIVALGSFFSLHTALVVSRLLSSSEAYVRNAALAILQMLGGVALPVLAELISHQDCDLRKLAADALNKIPGNTACSLLIEGLGDRDSNVVSACAEALGNRRDLRIMPALTATLVGTDNVWVAFAVIESLATTGDNEILPVIEQFLSKKSWSRKEHITLAGIWAIAVSKLGDERQLPAVWEMYHDKVLSIGQMLILLENLQQRGVTLQIQQVATQSMLEVFFAEKLKKSTINEVILAVHIVSRSYPALLYHYLSVMVDDFSGEDVVMEELITAIKLSKQVTEPGLQDAGMYKLLSYMYEHDPYLEHRYFILTCPEIFYNEHYTETWDWLVDSLVGSDGLLQLAAIRGMCRMGEAGKQYLEKLCKSFHGKDEETATLIRQELKYEWGPAR